MAKINATYSSGYYLAPDVDYRKLEEQQRLERKRNMKKDEALPQSERSAIRQTFAMPFNVVCLHCNSRIARGTHGYVNRRATDDKYMGIRIWELEFRCIFCKGHIYLITDYETAKLTGGYHCSRNCRRGEGDFYGMNQLNEELKAQQAAEKAEKGTVDALERENETMRQLQERDRLVEEVVESRAGMEEIQTRDELLQAIRTKKLPECPATDGEVTDSAGRATPEEEEAYQRFEAQLRLWGSATKPPPPQHGWQGPANSYVDGDEADISVALAMKYAGHGDKRGNVFMDDSDDGSCGDCDDKPAQLAKAGMSSVKVPSAAPKKDSAKTVSVSQRGSVLASLLDD
ncbi:unnamed protein product [Trypanosoma congolense IL3000]|uniref:WGS project CAEQ00000000 data, annotated contig 541 n=1 Tax=Trypanosoma congolense (strain IL3000) TaxID=1068625 RepID=F9WGS8_TRYCI|nr:unnamed protein product [Trypanosoma congolense IL3000]